jgi:hypothetical protein
VKYSIGATVRRGEEIPLTDKVRGLGVLSKLLKELSESVPLMVKKELQAAGIQNGEDAILRLTPIKAAHTISAGRSAHVQLSIIGGQDKSEIWSATVRVNASKGENDALLAQRLAQTMSAELKAAGWI